MNRVRNYINGEWVGSDTKEYGDVWCPATGEKIAEAPFSTAADVDKAVRAANEAFEDWRCTPPLTRARHLFKLRDCFENAFEDIARTLVTEEGKTIDEARGEVRRMIENVEHATGITTLMTGYNLEDIAHGIDCTAERQPIGAFGAIAPFNFPAMVPWWFLPYAVAAGNTFIVKPSEQVPMTQTRIFEAVEECGFPEGVVNMVHGAKETVNAMLYHPHIKGISFVGSSSTARYIYKACGETGKRVQALGGAKNFVLVMPDAELDRSIPSLITSFYGCAGERCLSGAVLVAVGDVYEPLKEKFTAAAKALKVGNGLDESVQMGPVATKAHMERILGYIEKGIQEGAKLMLDGRNIKVPGYEKGFFIGPTIFDDVRPDMTIATEENLRAGCRPYAREKPRRGHRHSPQEPVRQRRVSLHDQRQDCPRIQVSCPSEHDKDQPGDRGAHVLFPFWRREGFLFRRSQRIRKRDGTGLHRYEGGDPEVDLEAASTLAGTEDAHNGFDNVRRNNGLRGGYGRKNLRML